MPLIPLTTLLGKAVKGRYAVGYFEAWDQYSLEAVLEAAEECESPVIIGFGGVQMEQGWFAEKGLLELAAIGRVAAERAKVKVSYILNEVKEFKHIMMGINYGFNVVMMDTSYLPLKENIAVTKKIVEIAHKNKVAVEGELGRLPEGRSKTTNKNSLTDLDETEYFVKETGIDALSISIGNVHCLTEGKAKIDFNLLVRLKQMVKVPFVVHGGTGFPDNAVPRVIEMGVAKFNVGTILKQIFWSTIRETVGTLPSTINVQEVIGSRKAGDFLEKAKNKMKSEVKRRMRVYGSAGKA